MEKKIERLGGVYSPHLSKHVTHLLAGRILNSPKYLMAKRLGLPVLFPKFIDDCFARIHLGDVDLRQMEKLHAVPVLYGCTVGATGFESDERQRMGRLITSCGGIFAVDFNANCTHLVIAEGARSLKFQYAIKWGVNMVTPKWVYDSVSKRICLDSKEYRLNTEEVSQRPTQSFPYGDLTAEEVGKQANLVQYFDGFHIYVGDLQTSDRLALLKRLILVAGGTRHSDLFDKSLITHFVVHNQTLLPKELDQLRQFDEKVPLVVHDQWLFACFFEKALVPIDPYLVNVKNILKHEPDEDLEPIQLANQAASTSWSLKLKSSQATQLPPSQPSLPLFAGISFSINLPEGIRAAQITDLIEQNGGQVSTHNSDYIVMPMIMSPYSGGGILVNELWIEASVSQGQLMDTNSWLFSPIEAAVDQQAFSQLRISVSGFAGIERDYYGRIITAAGAIYTDNLSKKNTHLIAIAPVGPKYDFSKSVGISCTTSKWLLDSIRAGCVLSPVGFSLESVATMGELQFASFGTPIQLDDQENQSSISCNSRPSSVKRKRNAKVFTVETPIRNEVTKRLKDAAAKVAPTGLSQDTQPNSLMRGLVFATSQRLWHRHEEMHDLVTEMGGAFVWSYDPSCTHYIHQGNIQEETFREFKMVRQHGKWIVSPWWLLHSKEAGQRLAEIKYPHTYSNAIPPTSQPTTPRIIEPSPVTAKPLIIPVSPSSIDFDTLLSTERRPNKPNISYDLSGPIKPSTKEEPAATRIFALSGLTPDQRTYFSKALSEFPGTKGIRSASNWDMATTHLIIGSLTKSEKFLASCAAGIWILRPEYVEACVQAGHLVDERRYEWQDGWPTDPFARSPSYWRERGGKAFDGWRVLLVADQKRAPGLKSILLAGGATVGTLNELITDPTHILVSSQQMRNKIPPELLVEKMIHNIDLIADHLIKS